MVTWDRKRYEREKQSFIRQRLHHSPLWSQFTLLFGVSWGAAWLSSWLLWRLFSETHAWARSLPVRYAIAFLVAYAGFFLAVRGWIEIAKYHPEHRDNASQIAPGTLAGSADAGFIVFAVLAMGFVVSGLFMATGGAPMLLETAFEAAFAGVVVSRPLSGDIVLGDWKMRLLMGTWTKALVSVLMLVAVAAWMQHHAPQATTFAGAVRAMMY